MWGQKKATVPEKNWPDTVGTLNKGASNMPGPLLTKLAWKGSWEVNAQEK